MPLFGPKNDTYSLFPIDLHEVRTPEVADWPAIGGALDWTNFLAESSPPASSSSSTNVMLPLSLLAATTIAVAHGHIME